MGLINPEHRCSSCGSRLTDWICTSRYGGRPAWNRDGTMSEAPTARPPITIALGKYLQAIETWRRDGGYELPGEFVVVSAVVPD